MLAFTHFQGIPAFLPGTIKQLMPEVGHAGITIRRDYRQLVGDAFYTVVPLDFVFSDMEATDIWCKKILFTLEKFRHDYDSSEEAWVIPALTWEHSSQEVSLLEGPSVLGSALLATHSHISLDETLVDPGVEIIDKPQVSLE